MMLIPPGINVLLAPGFTDLRRGLDGLAEPTKKSFA